jgi:SAM-dependent methyltransferase
MGSDGSDDRPPGRLPDRQTSPGGLRENVVDPTRFYDDLAEYYDLIYADWARSMEHQGRAIAQVLDRTFPERERHSVRVLDVSAGIGTQTIPLAQAGYWVTARDISPGAIARLSREAASRGLLIDAAPADMRTVAESIQGSFDAAIAFDNSIPHLQNDAEILLALRQFREVLVPGGLLLLSVRDYEKVDRSPQSVHPYGERTRHGRTFRLEQRWSWTGPSHYRTRFVIEELRGGSWVPIKETEGRYYAIPVVRMLDLMAEAGFSDSRICEVEFFQPVLTGRSSV